MASRAATEEKIAKLLAKAADQAVTPAEASAYTAKAREMARAHDITLPLRRAVIPRVRQPWSAPANASPSPWTPAAERTAPPRPDPTVLFWNRLDDAMARMARGERPA